MGKRVDWVIPLPIELAQVWRGDMIISLRGSRGCLDYHQVHHLLMGYVEGTYR